MSTPKHTPGPWSTFGPVKYQVYGGDPVRRIVVVDYTTGSGTEEHNANAALIAAAPAMYEEVRAAFELLIDLRDRSTTTPAYHAIIQKRIASMRQALAQAEGK